VTPLTPWSLRLEDIASLRFQELRPGVEIHVLHDAADGARVAILRYASGASVPSHRHEGYEYIYVLDGAQRDERGIYSAGSFVINGTGIIVTIRNLSFNNNSGIAGTSIDFQSGAALHIENCVIQNLSHNSPYVGIKFRPSVPGAHLFVTDTIVKNSGTPILGSIGGAIVVSPQSGGTAQVALNRVTVAKNVFGIVADGTGSSGGINMTISDSVASGNSRDGVLAVTPSGGAPIGVMVTNTKLVNNAFGIRSIGPNVIVRAGDSTITGNGIGLSFSGGGTLLSYGTNKVQANGSDGAFSGPVGLQ